MRGKFTTEEIAQKFREAMVDEAPPGIKAAPWSEMSEDGRQYILRVVEALLGQGVIIPGEADILPSEEHVR
ncbi:hypothetical protein GCM10010423_64840 [Streptomyces levis]|uniref:Uncharacterized protein n=1 Tax=Streptomyces levis TaxID=285566 RepID=A0ABN3P5X7_9ACTN